MTTLSPVPISKFISSIECQGTVARLIGNLGGFVYRRQHDARWTMDFVSEGIRDVTGYDPHRFIGNQSLAFGDLIARADWRRVNEQVRQAVNDGRRATVEYFIRVAHGGLVLVEDRLTPVIGAAGTVLAIEGIVDRARSAPQIVIPLTGVPHLDEMAEAQLITQTSR